MKNVNHKNFFKQPEKPKEVVVEKVIEKPKEIIKVEKVVEKVEDFYQLTKKEQVDKLEKFGVSDKDIKKLKYEEDRVKKLMELSR